MFKQTLLASAILLMSFVTLAQGNSAPVDQTQYVMPGTLRYNIALDIQRCRPNWDVGSYMQKDHGNLFQFLTNELRQEPSLWNHKFNQYWLDTEKTAVYLQNNSQLKQKFEVEAQKVFGKSCEWRYESYGARPDKTTMKLTAMGAIEIVSRFNKALKLNLSKSDKQKIAMEVGQALLLMQPAYPETIFLVKGKKTEENLVQHYVFDTVYGMYTALNRCSQPGYCDKTASDIASAPVLKAAFGDRYTYEDLSKNETELKNHKTFWEKYNPFDAILEFIGLLVISMIGWPC